MASSLHRIRLLNLCILKFITSCKLKIEESDGFDWILWRNKSTAQRLQRIWGGALTVSLGFLQVEFSDCLGVSF